ncbi:hypothetical protein GQR58_001881 [Nymphon striatum]|nr:hypothetical protein GQR58_001881 [Nymphon striatum]
MRIIQLRFCLQGFLVFQHYCSTRVLHWFFFVQVQSFRERQLSSKADLPSQFYRDVKITFMNRFRVQTNLYCALSCLNVVFLTATIDQNTIKTSINNRNVCNCEHIYKFSHYRLDPESTLIVRFKGSSCVFSRTKPGTSASNVYIGMVTLRLNIFKASYIGDLVCPKKQIKSCSLTVCSTCAASPLAVDADKINLVSKEL